MVRNCWVSGELFFGYHNAAAFWVHFLTAGKFNVSKGGGLKVSNAYESQHQHGAFDKTGGFRYFLVSPRSLGK